MTGRRPVTMAYPCIRAVRLDALSGPTSGLVVLGPAHGSDSRADVVGRHCHRASEELEQGHGLAAGSMGPFPSPASTCCRYNNRKQFVRQLSLPRAVGRQAGSYVQLGAVLRDHE